MGSVVQDIQRGELEKIGQLWNMVRRFIAHRAISYQRQFPEITADVEDLIQEGYFSLCDAVQSYSPDRGTAFTTYLSFYLRSRWRRAVYCLERPNPLDMAYSLDEPLDDGETPLLELIPDSRAEAAFSQKEDEIVSGQLRETFKKALANTPDGEIIIRKYFRGETGPEIAAAMGIETAEVYRAEKKALQQLRRNPSIRKLRDYDFYHGVGLQMWRDTGMSIEERYLIRG